MPLKYLRNFWRTLDIPLINCETNPILAWSEDCVISSKATRDPNPDADTAINNPPNATFEITGTKLYEPVVTLPTQEDNKLLEQSKAGFKVKIKWNKDRSEMTNQIKNNNLNNLIDITLDKVKRLIVLSVEN